MFRFTKKIILFLLLMTAILRGSAQDVQQMSLEGAIAYAMKNSNAIKGLQLGVKDADELIAATKATGLPQVNAELGYNFFYQLPRVVFPKSFGEANAIPFINIGRITYSFTLIGPPPPCMAERIDACMKKATAT